MIHSQFGLLQTSGFATRSQHSARGSPGRVPARSPQPDPDMGRCTRYGRPELRHHIQIAVITIGATCWLPPVQEPRPGQVDDGRSLRPARRSRRTAAAMPLAPAAPPIGACARNHHRAPEPAPRSEVDLLPGLTSASLGRSLRPPATTRPAGSVRTPLRTLGRRSPSRAPARRHQWCGPAPTTESVGDPVGTDRDGSRAGRARCVWFGGSDVVTGWTADGSTMAAPTAGTSFDTPHLHPRRLRQLWLTSGASLNPRWFPMAAHPGSGGGSAVAPQAPGRLGGRVGPVGSTGRRRITRGCEIGTDPSGHEVRIDADQGATDPGHRLTTVRGMASARYSPPRSPTW